MDRQGPIVLIDDDIDDVDLMVDAYGTLSYKNKLLVFHDSIKAYEYLTQNDIIPFLIISDIIMPKMNGLELQEKLKAQPQFSTEVIPFIFFTGAAELPHDVTDTHLIEHGYFEKRTDFNELRNTLEKILRYWSNT